MSANLLQSLEILSQFVIHVVGQNLWVLAIHNIALSIKEPSRDLILGWVIYDGDNPFEFFRCNFASSKRDIEISLTHGFWSSWGPGAKTIPFVQINIGFLTNQIRVSAANTLDLGEGVHDLLFAIDVGVEETKDELKVRFFSWDKRCEREMISLSRQILTNLLQAIWIWSLHIMEWWAWHVDVVRGDFEWCRAVRGFP